MKRTAGDLAAERALEERLAQGPCDVVALAAALRAALPDAFRGQEGALHPLLHRLRKEGRARPLGRAPSGGALWGPAAPAGEAPAPAIEPPLDAPPPVGADDSRAALRVAEGARDAEDRGRIAADVLAHLASLPPAPDRARAFGSAKHAGALVRRVDRGRAAIVLPRDGGERFRRFLVHEGPGVAATLGLLALVWLFVLEPRVIPSNSMRPGLRPGDRVVVWKPGSSSTPDRWSVVVFRRKDDGVVLIKRVVGLPGERVWIANGEVHTDDGPLVKPDDVREAVRETILDGPAPPLVDGDVWSGSGLRRGIWRLRTPLFAHHPTYREDGGVDASPAQPEPVHDVYVEAEFEPRPEMDVGLFVEWVTVDGRPANAVAGVGVRRPRGDAGAVVAGPVEVPGTDPEPAAGSAPLPLPRGVRRLAISVVDGVLRASADGREIAEARVDAPAGHARLLVEGDLRRLRIDRDVHYTHSAHAASFGLGAARAVTLRDDELFVLGDHSSNSRDSRFHEVGPVQLSRVIGKAVFRVWPPLRIGPVR